LIEAGYLKSDIKKIIQSYNIIIISKQINSLRQKNKIDKIGYNNIMKVVVIAHPNSKKTLTAKKKPRIEKDLQNTLHVYVSQPPLEGKANRAVIEALAKYFGVKKSSIKLLKGEKSKTKLFEILSF